METKTKEKIVTDLVEEALVELEKEGNELSPAIRLRSKEACINILTGKMSGKEALHFTDEMIEKCYRFAYTRFQAGKYDDALMVFDFLRKVDPTSYRYSFCIAACHQYKKEYIQALGAYIVCTCIEDDNPIPYFHMYDCFMELNDLPNALGTLDFVILISGEDPRFTVLKEKALLEKKYIEAELNKLSSKA